jgi:hypothetical protein
MLELKKARLSKLVQLPYQWAEGADPSFFDSSLYIKDKLLLDAISAQ